MGMDGQLSRRKEIIDLNSQLNAVDILDQLTHVVHFTQRTPTSTQKPSFYLIRYDGASKEVSVEPKFIDKDAFASYIEAEQGGRYESDDNDAVLVDVNKIDILRKAFPNYFGDV